MGPTNEHDDDLEPEVEEGAEFETEIYQEEDDQESPPDDNEDSEDEAGDTI